MGQVLPGLDSLKKRFKPGGIRILASIKIAKRITPLDRGLVSLWYEKGHSKV